MSTRTDQRPKSKQRSSGNQPTTGQREEWRQYAARGADQVQEVIRDNAGRSMFISFAAGLGVGVLLGTVLGGSRQPERSAYWLDRSTAENLGRRFLSQIEGLLPDAVSRKVGL